MQGKRIQEEANLAQNARDDCTPNGYSMQVLHRTVDRRRRPRSLSRRRNTANGNGRRCPAAETSSTRRRHSQTTTTTTMLYDLTADVDAAMLCMPAG